jgi:hypothetical protein
VTYAPQTGVFAGRPPCAACFAAYRLHHDGECPSEYRPDTVDVARRELAAAEDSGGAARVFIARGNLQRLSKRA